MNKIKQVISLLIKKLQDTPGLNTPQPTMYDFTAAAQHYRRIIYEDKDYKFLEEIFNKSDIFHGNPDINNKIRNKLNLVLSLPKIEKVFQGRMIEGYEMTRLTISELTDFKELLIKI